MDEPEDEELSGDKLEDEEDDECRLTPEENDDDEEEEEEVAPIKICESFSLRQREQTPGDC